MLIKGNPLAHHPGVHVSKSLFCRPGVSIKLHDYLKIKLSHGWYDLGLLPPGNLFLELNILLIPQLDSPFFEERPTFYGLKPLLVFRTPELLSMKVYIFLRGRTGTLSSGILPGPLGWKLLWSHFLWGCTKTQQMKAKTQKWWLRAAKLVISVSTLVLESLGKILGVKNGFNPPNLIFLV